MLPWKLPVHAGTYRAILDLPETANYAAAHAEVIMNIIPAKATIEIHPVSFSFDEQTHEDPIWYMVLEMKFLSMK